MKLVRLSLPPVVRLKDLAKRLKVTPGALANRLPGVRKSGGRVEVRPARMSTGTQAVVTAIPVLQS